MHKILFLEMMDTTSAYYRIYNINDALYRNNQAIAISSAALLHEVCKDDVNLFAKKLKSIYTGADFIIIEGSPALQTREVIDNAKAMGKIILIEVDDLVDNPTEWIDKATGKRARDKWLQRAAIWPKADGFITSTPYLARHYSKKFNKPAWIFDNYLDTHDPRWQQQPQKEPNKIVIGYMGSISHIADLEIIEEPALRILEEYPQTELHIMGAMRARLTMLKHPRIKEIPSTMDIRQYPKDIAHFDIGLIPLLDAPFNLAKSDLKVLEYGALGIPAIASKLPTYSNTIINNENGLLARNKPEDWYKAMKKLIDNPNKRKLMGLKAKEYVYFKRSILDNSHKYVKILDEAKMLFKRQPEKRTGLIIPKGRIIIPTC